MRSESPIAATFVAWGNAWLTGAAKLDHLTGVLEKGWGPQLVAVPADIAPGSPLADIPLRDWLLEHKDMLDALRLALPVPGDPLGLAGPPEFNAAAIEAGQAAISVIGPTRIGMVPMTDLRGSSYAGVRWITMPASPHDGDVPQLADAERALTYAMNAATEALTSVEGPSQGFPSLDGAADALAPGYPGRAHRVAALAGRLAFALRLADERGLTAGQVGLRGQALRELDHAVRRAQVAAHHAIVSEPAR